MRAKFHNEAKPRGVRDARKCKVQAGGWLIWIRDGQPEAWCDRPHKFPGHISVMLRKPGTVITDIKWSQLGSSTWWRLPQYPDGEARS